MFELKIYARCKVNLTNGDCIADLYLPREVPVLNEIPQPLEFFRNWVSTNIPFIVKGGIKDWPAVKKWNKSYFFQTLKDKRISVAVTPNGYADAVADAVIDGNTIRCFVLPEERTMLFGDFLKKLNGEMIFTGNQDFFFCLSLKSNSLNIL